MRMYIAIRDDNVTLSVSNKIKCIEYCTPANLFAACKVIGKLAELKWNHNDEVFTSGLLNLVLDDIDFFLAPPLFPFCRQTR